MLRRATFLSICAICTLVLGAGSAVAAVGGVDAPDDQPGAPAPEQPPATGPAAPGTGGLPTDSPGLQIPPVPGAKARIVKSGENKGLAIAPEEAPDVIKRVIAAGNIIAKKPYIYGGGHQRWTDRGYDCSGSVGFALHGAGLLDESMPSSGFMNWGASGPGSWITIYANGGHMYMTVAGLRYDTGGVRQDGSRWHRSQRSSSGYKIRHIEGL